MSSFEEDPDIFPEEDIPVLSVPSGGEDWDGAANAKDAANEAKSSGNYDFAIENYTKAMELGSISAIVLANRAECLLKVRRPLAAVSDCNEAIKINPDSAKALRCRGTSYRHLGKWDLSNKDLSAAQSIDYNPDAEAFRQFVSQKAAALEAHRVQQRIADEQILREKVKKQREELAKRAQEEREEEERERASRRAKGGMPGGMPGGMGGMPGGMGGMPGGMGEGGLQQIIMQMLMSDPELAAGMQNPKVMKAFTSMMGGDMSGPDSEDPEVKAFMEKFMAKMGPLMGMMGGMGGGMGGMGGGMGGMGGMGGGMGGMGGFGEDDEDGDDGMPDLEEDDNNAPAVEEVD